MATKLTRCLCGKIYDSGEVPVCPACGAAPRHEIPAAPLPEAGPTVPELRVTNSEPLLPPKLPVGGEKREFQVSVSVEQLKRIAVVALVGLAICGGIVWLLRRPADDKPAVTLTKIEQAVVNNDAKTDDKPASPDRSPIFQQTEPDPKLLPTPVPTPPPGPAVDPSAPRTWIVDAEKRAGSDGTEIEPVLEKARDGDTITLKPGTYAGGFLLDKKIRITGAKADPEQFVIDAGDQKRPIRIVAKGATLANLQILNDTNGKPALMLESDAEAVLENCDLKIKTGNGIIGKSPAAFTARNCTFSSGDGRVMSLRGPTKVELTQCDFTGGSTAFHADHAAQFTLRGCKFKNLGERGVKEPAVKIFGTGSSLTAEDCEISDCRLPFQAEEGATLAFTKCIFTGNGVRGDKGDFTQGIIAVDKKAAVTLKDVTFEKNVQGLSLFEGGTAQIEDCKFTNGGLLMKDAGFMNFCMPLRLHGEGAKAMVRRTTFAQCIPYAILLQDGADVSVEDSEFTGMKLTALIAGRTAEMRGSALNEVRVKKSRFSGNMECISLSGTKGTVDDCDFQDNGGGLSASGAGTTANVTGGTATGQKDYGFLIAADAMLTLTSAKLEGNRHGVQVGVPNKPAERPGANLVECKFSGSTDADVLALGSSTVTLRQCEFDAEGARVRREKSAVVQSEPPLAGIVDMSSSGKGGTGGSSGSNTRGPVVKRPSSTPRPRQPGDPVRDIINTVDRVRRMFR